MPALLRVLLDDVAGFVLPDHLIDEPLGDFDPVGVLDLEAAEEVVVLDRLVYLGVDLDVAPEPVDLVLELAVRVDVAGVGGSGFGAAGDLDVRRDVVGRSAAPVVGLVGLVGRVGAPVGGVAVFTNRSDSLPERKGLRLIYFPPTKVATCGHFSAATATLPSVRPVAPKSPWL